MGGILSQGEKKEDQPIAYASQTLIDNELKYDIYKKEALAIVYCVKHFLSYLYGRKFTDNKSVQECTRCKYENTPLETKVRQI